MLSSQHFGRGGEGGRGPTRKSISVLLLEITIANWLCNLQNQICLQSIMIARAIDTFSIWQPACRKILHHVTELATAAANIRPGKCWLPVEYRSSSISNNSKVKTFLLCYISWRVVHIWIFGYIGQNSVHMCPKLTKLLSLSKTSFNLTCDRFQFHSRQDNSRVSRGQGQGAIVIFCWNI